MTDCHVYKKFDPPLSECIRFYPCGMAYAVIATINDSNYQGSSSGMLIIQSSVIIKPGDCDYTGTVTIAEVQSAINMFLGLNAVDACVDQDGAGGVSIAEAQKTINSFLGL